MSVGVLGSGQVGQALGRGFASRGHGVMLGTRSPGSEKVQAWFAEGEERSAGTFALRLAFGFEDSLGERVQRKLPESAVVKAFNTRGRLATSILATVPPLPSPEVMPLGLVPRTEVLRNG